jgi:hypothetical protein
MFAMPAPLTVHSETRLLRGISRRALVAFASVCMYRELSLS